MKKAGFCFSHAYSIRVATLLLTVALIAPINNVDAQQLCARIPFYNIEKVDYDYNDSLAYFNAFCSDEVKEEKDVDRVGATLGIPFKGIPVKFGFNRDKESFTHWRKQFCSETRYNRDVQIGFTRELETISEAALKAFNQCMNTAGLHVWVEYGPSEKIEGAPPRDEFFLAARYRADGVPYTVMLTKVDPGGNATCKDLKEFMKKPVTGATRRLRCERANKYEGVMLLVNAERDPIGGDQLIISAAWKPPIPTGDIQDSELRPEQNEKTPCPGSEIGKAEPVRNRNGGFHNVARLYEAEAGASSTHVGFPSSNLNDGWYDNCQSWIAVSNPAKAWIDLKDRYEISQVGLSNVKNGLAFHRFLCDRYPNKFFIYVTDDLANPGNPKYSWTPEKDGPKDFCRAQQFGLAAGTIGRYVVVVIESTGDAQSARIDEIEVFSSRRVLP